MGSGQGLQGSMHAPAPSPADQAPAATLNWADDVEESLAQNAADSVYEKFDTMSIVSET
jgi:hypothetical protein